MPPGPVDLDRLLKLRLVIARQGEADRMSWWGTKSVLGRMGRTVIGRGMPRTHPLARARIVFAVASQRCKQLFSPSGCVTLWSLPADTERSFDDRWALWLKERWVRDLIGEIEEPSAESLEETLTDDLEILDDEILHEAQQLKRSSGSPSAALPGLREVDDETLALLAAGFCVGGKGDLVIPYARVEK